MAEDRQDDHEKSEEPTQRRLEEAHCKGDVPKSQEVTTWFVILGATVVVLVFSKDMAASLAATLKGFLAHPHAITVDGANLRDISTTTGSAVFGALLVPLALLFAAAVAGNLLQHRPVFTGERMMPKLSKISPAAGWKRLFSVSSLVNFAKGLAKLGIVAAVMFAVMWPERDRLDGMVGTDVDLLLPSVHQLALRMLTAVVVALTIIAGLDLLYQRHSWYQKQRMSVKELRDEYKQMEGDPSVRAKLRQVRIERGRRRMVAKVPEATVVITNPTHFAVALKYEQGMNAPVCLAKGIDSIALKIRAIAAENGIPVIENPPLARALHDTVELDEEIPPEHYRAVAQVIGYVMQLRGRARRRMT